MKASWLLIGMLALASCSDSKLRNEATEAAKDLYSAIKSEDTEKAQRLYSGFGLLPSYYKSDSVRVQDVLIEKDTVVVKLLNYYTNGVGKLTERPIDLYYMRMEGKPLSLVNSKGMGNWKDDEDYPVAVKAGCLDMERDTLDRDVALALTRANTLVTEKTIEVLRILKAGCKVKTWTWESGYAGSASGKGIVENNTTFSIPRVQYNIEYSDRSDRVITKDDGYVTRDAIDAGSSQSFTFYTSYVGGAQTASIWLTFDTDVIKEYVRTMDYTGNECAEQAAKDSSDEAAAADSTKR